MDNFCENHPDIPAEWPSATAEYGLCQECWESLCSGLWWEMIRSLGDE